MRATAHVRTSRRRVLSRCHPTRCALRLTRTTRPALARADDAAASDVGTELADGATTVETTRDGVMAAAAEELLRYVYVAGVRVLKRVGRDLDTGSTGVEEDPPCGGAGILVACLAQ